MNPRAQIRMLPDSQRVHMQDGPIDLILEAFGPPGEVERAYQAAAARFVTVLDELCAELSFLRQRIPPFENRERWGTHIPTSANGPIARRMVEAVHPYATEHFITPMAAVAGAVAEEILGAMTSEAELLRVYANDGGDIALHLTPGEQFVIGMVERPDRPSLFGTTTVEFDHPIRGIATSGWRGRSSSLGIADAVTVLADTAAGADAAATIVANAVDLPGHPAIGREPACDLAPDSDLGERLVTQAVGKLAPVEIREALDSGLRIAELLRQRGLIRAAALNLQGEIRVCGRTYGDAALAGQSNRSLVHA